MDRNKFYGLSCKYLPIIKWSQEYQLSYLKNDLIAGATVGLTLIPQALAYGSLAKLPPYYGLYSAFWGPFLYFFLGTSRDLTLGPTAILSLLVAHYSEVIPGISMDATVAVALALLAGCIQLALGLTRMGFITNYMSPTVVSGFTTSGAILIAWSQVTKIVGIKCENTELFASLYELFSNIREINLSDFFVGTVCIIFLLVFRIIGMQLKKYKRNNESIHEHRFYNFMWFICISSNIIVIVLSSLFAYILSVYSIGRLNLTGQVKNVLPVFELPKFHIESGNVTVTTSEFFQKIGTGIPIIALIALVEAMAIGKAFARKNGYAIRSSQEFIAIGISNIIGSLFQSFPITGSFSRTAINSQCSSRSPFSGVITGSIILLALKVLTPYFEYIPKTSLAAIIIVAVLFMTDFKFVLRAWSLFKYDCFTWVVTVAVSLVSRIEYGVFSGIAVSILPILYTAGRPRFIKEEKVPEYHGSCLWYPFHSKLVSLIEEADQGVFSVINIKGVQCMDSAIFTSLLEIGEEYKEKNKYLFIITNYHKLIEMTLRTPNNFGIKCMSSIIDIEEYFPIEPNSGWITETLSLKESC